MKNIDFGQVAKSYARSRNDIPHSLFESLQLRNVSFDRKQVADIGCGSGALTRKLNLYKANVIGVEPSEELLNEAKGINRLEYLNIPYQLGTAEDTGLSSDAFDIVTVMRAWHWFNRQESIKEVKSILKNYGTFIVADSGFVDNHPAITITFDVLKKYVTDGLKPAGSKALSSQRINGFPVEWFEEWKVQGFEIRDFYKLDYQVEFTNKAWVERVASLSYLAGLEETDRSKALLEIYETLTNQLGEDAHHKVLHACQVCIMKLNK